MVKFPKLDKSFVEKMRSALTKKEKELEERKTALVAEDPFAQPDRLVENEPEDDASEQEGHGRVEALIDQLDKLLIQVKMSLSKIRRGTYGTCESCGCKIDKARLAAMPMAGLCVECERKSKE